MVKPFSSNRLVHFYEIIPKASGATEDECGGSENQTEVDQYISGEGKKQTEIQMRPHDLSNMEETVIKPEDVNELTGDRREEVNSRSVLHTKQCSKGRNKLLNSAMQACACMSTCIKHQPTAF